jgi:hypothetical protein
MEERIFKKREEFEMLGRVEYVDQQRRQICPHCPGEIEGERLPDEVQEQGSIFSKYVCQGGHEYEIDRVFESSIPLYPAERRNRPVAGL